MIYMYINILYKYQYEIDTAPSRKPSQKKNLSSNKGGRVSC